ncbi:type II secretion system F family protein [Pseudomonas rubra]|uniref:Type II secretion system F family protein n=1 Tax=Pseudomonas rubra TaxID=2942627 RepID=A0ABT5P3S9_9PSED|nr:type II secretion system F family protein [Pseudomonas rubra]MDD1012910.1 type II secretion system F family protein [Pseudomonas rubra]MDD1038222.1 type II secretion system F family protein [Pseudomonas rubra]MDD1156699.1 type II secretion system F family protein [Pseudomonas rubra]
MALLLCALLLFAAFALLVGQLLRERRRQHLVALRLQGQLGGDNRLGNWLQQIGSSRLGQRVLNLDGETRLLLDRIGWRRSRQRAVFATCQIGVPLLALGLGVAVQQTLYHTSQVPWLVLPLCAMGAGYLLPKRLLALAAGRRQQQVAREVSTFIPLLRILFESGLAVEQALRVLSQESRKLLPVLSEELRAILVRVDSGLALAPELEKTAQRLGVDEFSDACVILQQLLTQGGGAMKSLLALKQLLDDRRLTHLQERISKMSGKMSMVMMVFLFPALLIVLAGPGLSALGRALGS